jgi:ribonuclease P protein component
LILKITISQPDFQIVLSLFSLFTFYNHLIITHKFTLKANERLKSAKVIQRLFKEGKSVANFPLRVMYLETEQQLSSLQAGFTVNKKNFKKAVDRNRIKRVMRESYRLQKNDLKSELEKSNKNLALFFIYTGKELPEYELVFKKTGSVLEKIEKSISSEKLT